MVFIKKYMTTDDNIKIYYRHYKSKNSDEHFNNEPKIICLPALTRNSKSFHHYALHIVKKFELSVIAIDPRGRGQSGYDSIYMNYNLIREAQDTLAVLQHENIDTIVIIGTSRGGMQASLLANIIKTQTTHIKKLQGVILNDIGATIPMVALKRLKKLFTIDTHFIGDYETTLRFFYKGDMGMTKNLSSEQEVNIIQSLYRYDNGNYYLDYDYQGLGQAYLASLIGAENLEYFDLRTLFSSLNDIPTLLLHGENSDILTDICVRDTKALLPHIEYHKFQNRGHVLYFNELDVIEICDKFLENYCYSID